MVAAEAVAAAAVVAAVAGKVAGSAGLDLLAVLAGLMEVAEADLVEAERGVEVVAAGRMEAVWALADRDLVEADGGVEVVMAGRMEAMWAVVKGMGAEAEAQVVMAGAQMVKAKVARRALCNGWSCAPITGHLACNMRCRSRKTSNPS